MIFRIILFALLVCKIDAFTQALFYANGATVVNSTVLKINGSFENVGNGSFQQNDTLIITGHFLNNATFNNSGKIDLAGNFTQNGILNAANSGSLSLMGNVQTIQGDSAIHFNHLAANGTGNKALLRDIQTNTLSLTDKEINVNNNILFVSSTNTNAISRTSGYISATFEGALKRKLIANTSSLFPLGWNGIYSPVSISIPIDSAEIDARFAFADANAEGLPRSFVDVDICSTNANFYHLIKSNASYTCAIQLETDLVSPFTHLCKRAPNGTSAWQVDNSFNFTTTANITNITSSALGGIGNAYLLCSKRPQQPTITGDSAVCENLNISTYQAGNFGNNALLWSVGGGFITGSAVSTTVNVDFTSIESGSVSLTATDGAGCSSLPTNFNVEILPKPTAVFSTLAPELAFEDQVFTFTNNTLNAPFFNWTINNDGPYIDSILQWAFSQPGEYLITLFATNNFGCTDTAQKKITIEEGIVFPNTFSPNGDGINDELSFTNSGMQNFSIRIFDRWGTLVFETNFSKLNWNGRDIAGELVPAGTYFYLLNAVSEKTKYEKRGSVSVYY
jgi:gliding motility-associated-like protein